MVLRMRFVAFAQDPGRPNGPGVSLILHQKAQTSERRASIDDERGVEHVHSLAPAFCKSIDPASSDISFDGCFCIP